MLKQALNSGVGARPNGDPTRRIGPEVHRLGVFAVRPVLKYPTRPSHVIDRLVRVSNSEPLAATIGSLITVLNDYDGIEGQQLFAVRRS
jgi:hypothetical protein